MLRSLLVANRGEIALRVMRTARAMGMRTIAVHTPIDRDAPHARSADMAVGVSSYLEIPPILEAAKRAGADAVHPGYGFLAENADFAQAVIDAGLAWVGPPPAAIRALGDKLGAKRLARATGVPVLPTYEKNPEFPLMLKAAAGGGGRGMRLVRSASQLEDFLAEARSEAKKAFGDDTVFLEKALLAPRHVEVQVFADTHGNCVHLGERDCSVQRRHQKLIEESPASLPQDLREKMAAAAIALARAAGYVGAGTVEFLVEDGRFWLMEANTRLQVEHPVTELVTGLDLVEWQLRVAAGEKLPLAQDEIRFSGHAIEARLCAEDPAHDFLPQSGRLALWQPADGVRVDHALESGLEIPPHYDSLLAKLIAHAPTRAQACAKLARALDDTVALGITTNKRFLASVLRSDGFAAGPTTGFLQTYPFRKTEPDDGTLAIAALLLASHADYGEWTLWSNAPAHVLRARFHHDIALTYGALPLQVLSIQENSARIGVKGVEETVHFTIEGETVHLARAGESWTLENTLHAPPARRAAAPAGKSLAAPMNGRVVAVHAKAGEKMDAGKPLVVLEAMKMEHGLALEVAVMIKAVHVAAGAQVSPGHLLVEFEAAA